MFGTVQFSTPIDLDPLQREMLLLFSQLRWTQRLHMLHILVSPQTTLQLTFLLKRDHCSLNFTQQKVNVVKVLIFLATPIILTLEYQLICSNLAKYF